MPAEESATISGGARGPGRALVGRLVRYGAGSAVATACSEVAFILLYGVLHSTTLVASVLGWLAGAVPNYWLNRSWTWGRRGRPSWRYELLPYVAIVVLTLLLAVGATTAVDSALSGSQVPGSLRAVLVGATFLAVYVAVFALRFVLLDRLFTRPADEATTDVRGTTATREMT